MPVKFDKLTTASIEQFRARVMTATYRQPLIRLANEVLKPIVDKRVEVGDEVRLAALTLFGELNVRLIDLPDKPPVAPPPLTVVKFKNNGDSGTIEIKEAHIGALTAKTEGRPKQQDAVLAASDRAHKVDLMAVFDGLGGEQEGDKASTMASSSLAQQFQADPVNFRLDTGMAEIHRLMTQAKAGKTLAADAGTTVAAALINETTHQLEIASDGDSRGMVVRSGELIILNPDDSASFALYQAGKNQGKPVKFPLTGQAAIEYYEFMREQKRTDKSLVKALGAMPSTSHPMVENPVPPFMVKFELQPGDVVILASDGLTDELSARELLGTVKAGGRLTELQLAAALLATVADPHDNVSINIKMLPGGPDEAETTIWSGEERDTFVDQMTSMLRMSPDLLAEFVADLRDKEMGLKEALMWAGRVGLQKSQELSDSQALVRRLQERVTALEKQQGTLETDLDKTKMAAGGSMQESFALLSAQWETIKAALNRVFEKKSIAFELQLRESQFAATFQSIIDRQAEPMKAKAVGRRSAEETRHRQIMESFEPLRGIVADLQADLGKLEAGKEVHNAVKASLEEQTEELRLLEQEEKDKHAAAMTAIEEELKAADSGALAQKVAAHQTAAETARLQLDPLQKQLNELKAAAAEIARALESLAAEISRSVI